ncbi:MAG: iron-sulfur cluster assembly accessory protein [Nitrospinota bacterium]
MSGPITLFDASQPKKAEGITITPAAQEKVNEILKAEGKAGHGLRVAVTAGGCSGHSYGLYFDEKPEADDIVIPAEGFSLFVDRNSMNMLGGVRIDYVDSIQGAGFKIENPNATSSCGCGKSFQA